MKPNFKDIEQIIAIALAEDIGKGDITGNLLIPKAATATLKIVSRETITQCGVDVAGHVFTQYAPDLSVTLLCKDGEQLEKGATLLRVKGNARAILAAERVALNLLQRLCSVATLTRRYVDAVHGTNAIILDTRKTMPGLRVMDKYAVRAGGGQNHRMRLDDAILIKDNHIAICGGITQALANAKAGNHDGLPIEIECDTLAQVTEALQVGVDRIMLDNMDLAAMKQAVDLVNGKIPLEASGNVSLETVRAIAETGVDFISVGKLTHSAPNVDLGLDIALDH